MKYNGVVISDVHVGVMDIMILYKEYKEIFLKNIKEMKKLDFLIITGDFFDHKYYLNDKESIMAYAMLKELIEICKEKDAVVRIVYGTESHECNQYDILSLLKIYDKVEVVKYVKEEELLPDLHVLYLPEEHIADKASYYEKYFTQEKKYDYIFGHGVIREVMKDQVVHMENKETKENKRKKVPIFSSAELNTVCKGQTFFGHYHINMNINDKIFSVGSYSRWRFGEEGQKGYYEISCNTEKETYKAKFIENTLARTFVTIGYGYDNEVFENEDNMNKALGRIESMIDNKTFDHVRFVFNIPKDCDNPESKVNFLKEKYKFNDSIKVEITHGYVEEKKKQQKEKLKEENKLYKFISDKDMALEDKVSQFIEIEYHKSIPSKNIQNYLYLPLKEVLEGE